MSTACRINRDHGTSSFPFLHFCSSDWMSGSNLHPMTFGTFASLYLSIALTC